MTPVPAPGPGENLLLDAAIVPSWGYVAPFRRFVAELLTSTCSDADHVARVAMTVHELLENAVKYGRGQVTVTLALDTRGFASRIEVGSRTTPERRREATDRINELRSSANREACYLTLMRRAAVNRTSGLGLARLATEGRMELSVRDSNEAFFIVARPAHPGASS